MKKNATFKENIEFLISCYERELENSQDRSLYEIELIEAYIDELKTILELSK